MKSLFKALAAFQQEVPTIHKGTEGYGYSYADLPTILDVINPLLQKHGLGYTQPPMQLSVKTILFHVESGEFIESIMDIPQNVSLAKMNDFQVLGSAITYIRRYQLSAMLGLVTDKDTDAGGQQAPKAATAPPKKQAAPVPKSERVIVADGDELFLKIVKAVSDGKATIQQALNKYNISDKVEASLKEKIQALTEIV